MSEEIKKLKPDEVQYLSFEGGGGKGGAFLGAIWALDSQNLGIINWAQHPNTNRRILDSSKIKGISGSSAGALTALFLSCGYTTKELEGIVLKSGKRGLFYDDALPRKIPKIVLKRQLAVKDSCIKPQKVETKLEYYQHTTNLIFKIPVIGDLLIKGLNSLSGGKEPLKKILDKNNLPKYLWNLVEDFGLMSGCNARSAIDELVAFKTRDEKDNRIYGATFKQHYEYHKIKLIVTGTDLEKGRTQFFSVDETPDFRVSDAVRISMSFPYVFKPIIIEEGKYKGTWVDGGLLNNIPVHAFDPPPGGVINDNILGIRLEIDKINDINSLSDFTKAFLSLIVAGSTELSQIVTEKEKKQTLMIDTANLSTLDFDPDEKDLKEAIDNGAKAVLDYFEMPSTLNPVNTYPAEPA